MIDLVEKWKLAARRDDLFNHMVPSDVRLLVGEIERLRIILTGLAKRHEGYEQGCGPCLCEWHEKARNELLR